ncbi:hypothetical protein BDF20DRAFT_835563 [Mycotypha africana]|uniref:uncharacterized protein n=1 Tax=Mycotypha africana TaxID=64632 RepID=UPI002300BF9C|nr:uncharacterized protein BDF20DRAFT_835563 [Mycotypha africana]KAI8979558.1 hypothetical protein BDF20DRAFT_835563 [Mycotypha africana]
MPYISFTESESTTRVYWLYEGAIRRRCLQLKMIKHSQAVVFSGPYLEKFLCIVHKSVQKFLYIELKIASMKKSSLLLLYKNQKKHKCCGNRAANHIHYLGYPWIVKPDFPCKECFAFFRKRNWIETSTLEIAMCLLNMLAMQLNCSKSTSHVERPFKNKKDHVAVMCFVNYCKIGHGLTLRQGAEPSPYRIYVHITEVRI